MSVKQCMINLTKLLATVKHKLRIHFLHVFQKLKHIKKLPYLK